MAVTLQPEVSRNSSRKTPNPKKVMPRTIKFVPAPAPAMYQP
jgi:hypothetical protein